MGDAKAGPFQLVISAPRLATVDVPFTLRNVPLVDNPQLAPRGGDIKPLILTR